MHDAPATSVIVGAEIEQARAPTAWVVMNAVCRLRLGDRGEGVGRHGRERRPLIGRHSADDVHQSVQRREVVGGVEGARHGVGIAHVDDRGTEPVGRAAHRVLGDREARRIGVQRQHRRARRHEHPAHHGADPATTRTGHHEGVIAQSDLEVRHDPMAYHAPVLDGLAVLVTNATTALGGSLVEALVDAGARVAGVDGGFAERGDAETAFAALTPIDAVVHVCVDERALVAQPPRRDRAGGLGGPGRRPDPRGDLHLPGRVSAFTGGRGRIVLVAPTVGFTGAAGLVPYTTAVEGVRSLAKSAARANGVRRGSR